MLAVSNLGYFSFISGIACPPFSKNGFLIHFSGAMTFALDHAPSKYIQIEQSTAKYGYIYGVFSRAVPWKSSYFVHSVSTLVLEVRYSCYYVLLVILVHTTHQLSVCSPQ